MNSKRDEKILCMSYTRTKHITARAKDIYTVQRSHRLCDRLCVYLCIYIYPIVPTREQSICRHIYISALAHNKHAYRWDTHAERGAHKTRMKDGAHRKEQPKKIWNKIK